MDRLSVFYPAKNEAGYVQAVIVESDLSVYQALGFVTSIDDLKSLEAEEEVKPQEPEVPTQEAEVTEEIAPTSKPDKKAKSNGDDTNKG